MPLIRNKHQPFFSDPDSPNNFNCGTERYCHPFNGGDTFMTQFYQTPCNANEVIDPEFDDFTLDPNIVVNGDFDTNPTEWTLGTGVTWDNINLRVDVSASTGNNLKQGSLPLVANSFYKITFQLSRTSGSVEVAFAYGDPLQTISAPFDTTGTHSVVLPFYATGDESITFIFDNFTGWIDNVTIEPINYNYWNPNGGWLLENGFACHIVGQTSNLQDTSPNYITANGYYTASITVTNYGGGSIDFYISDILVDTISANGTYTYYATPTINGTINIDTTGDFVGCISQPSCYELRNDYTAFIVDENGTEFEVSDYIEYFEQYVTLKFDFATVGNYELPTGCYNVKLYDQCIIASDNLIINGDFVDGYTNWNRNNGANQYDDTGNQMKLIFTPFSLGATDYITNGDFSSGSGWTLNAGWSVVGGKAVHTPGNTGTLFQTMTLPTPPLPATGYNYYVKFTVTNWSAGTINVKLGNAVNGTTYTWKGNDTFIQSYNPRQSGSVDFVFTPSSTFNGEIDDVACVVVNQSAFPILITNNIPTLTTGTYNIGWEIIGSSDANISVRSYLQGGTSVPSYQTAVGTYLFSQTYSNVGGQVYVVANFNKTSIDYIQQNMVEGDITIDNVMLEKIEPYEATYETECLSYNENGWDKTKMIVAWCDQPSFGFEFANTGFKLQQRALIRSINPSYPKQKSIQQMGNGNARVVYSEIEKYWEVHTDFASETFHDCMAVQLDCDHLQIGDTQGNGKEYIANADEYSPSWQGDGTYSLATATFELRIKEKGQIYNRHFY